MHRATVVQKAIDIFGAYAYVEIGVRDRRETFDRINAPLKTGVDPIFEDAQATDIAPAHVDEEAGWMLWGMRSDEWFADHADHLHDIKTVIFVDGDHRYGQVLRDVTNALALGAVVVMHDCLPRHPEHATPEKPDNGKAWCGEAWRVYRQFCNAPSMLGCVFADDHGVGVLKCHDTEYLAEIAKPKPRGQYLPPWAADLQEKRDLYNLQHPSQANREIARVVGK